MTVYWCVWKNLHTLRLPYLTELFPLNAFSLIKKKQADIHLFVSVASSYTTICQKYLTFSNFRKGKRSAHRLLYECLETVDITFILIHIYIQIHSVLNEVFEASVHKDFSRCKCTSILKILCKNTYFKKPTSPQIWLLIPMKLSVFFTSQYWLTTDSLKQTEIGLSMLCPQIQLRICSTKCWQKSNLKQSMLVGL